MFIVTSIRCKTAALREVVTINTPAVTVELKLAAL